VELWTRVRLQLLYSLWQAAEVATADRPPVAQAIAASVVAGIAAAIRLDWLRATLSAPELAGACGQWMTGSGHAMSPEAAIDQFAALWCVRGVLCQPPASPLHPPVVRWDMLGLSGFLQPRWLRPVFRRCPCQQSVPDRTLPSK